MSIHHVIHHVIRHAIRHVGRYVIVILALCGGASTALAADGVILIDQNRALAGNVTPGDAPGFPITLSQPGSYRLSSNLSVPVDTDALLIAADHITIDLNGFSIVGQGTGAEFGITSLAVDHADISIRNGAIANFVTAVEFLSITNSEVRGIRALHNRVNGIAVGDDAFIADNIISGNVRGLLVGSHAIVTGNISSDNTQLGIQIRCPGVVIGNTAQGNGLQNIDFLTSNGDCTAAHNSPLP